MKKNGDSISSWNYLLKPNIKWRDLSKDVAKIAAINNYKIIRIFKSNGIEILEDDIELIKNGEDLYISKGLFHNIC